MKKDGQTQKQKHGRRRSGKKLKIETQKKMKDTKKQKHGKEET